MILMYTYRLLAFVLVLITLCAPGVRAQTIEGSAGNWRSVTQHDADVSGAKELHVNRVQGNITLKGGNTSRISIIERLTMNSKTEIQAQNGASSAKLKIVRSGNVIELTSSDQNSLLRGASYEITLPAAMRVLIDVPSGNLVVSDLQNQVHLDTGSGNVEVGNVTGPVEIRSGSGNILLNNIRSTIVVNTSAGNVTATTIKSTLSVTTGGGNVEVADASGDVSLTTAGGSVVVRKIGGNARVFTSGGDISAQKIQGKLDASTSGGNIDLVDIVGRTSVSTSGGSIEGRNLSSWISAETSAGDVRLVGVRDGFQVIAEVGNVYVELEDARFLSRIDASIEGRFGNVTLILPESMNGQVSAVVSENGSVEFKNPGSRVEIIRERPSTQGDTLRRADYKIGSGGGRIATSTTSGRINISIRTNQ